MIRLIGMDELDILAKDPVRLHVNKLDVGKQVYVLDDLSAVICTCYCNDIPTSEKELEKFKDVEGDIIVAYTVWSSAKGAGRTIVLALRDLVLNNPNIRRLVTMSPKTEMAKKFHLSNGAFWLRENEETDNYEYNLYRDKNVTLSHYN